jgi:hypothetical protein
MAANRLDLSAAFHSGFSVMVNRSINANGAANDNDSHLQVKHPLSGWQMASMSGNASQRDFPGDDLGLLYRLG